MAGPFESVTRAAIDELILAKVQESKFGYILTKESFKELSDSIFDLLLTSRALKAAGDKLLTEGPQAFQRSSKRGSL